MFASKIRTWPGALAVSCVIGASSALGPIAGCGSSESCEQDFPPPQQISTASSPHRISYLSSNLGISGARWQNLTTGASGAGSVARVNECVGGFPFPRICGEWTRVTLDVTLGPGSNTVHTFESSDGCEWRSDYVIALM